jgi:hypothetical protein
VISVQTIVLSLESLQIQRNHNWLKSLSFFFSPALKIGDLRKSEVAALQKSLSEQAFSSVGVGAPAVRLLS